MALLKKNERPIFFSSDTPPIDWLTVTSQAGLFGPKGAALNALPRQWTLPYAIVEADGVERLTANGQRPWTNQELDRLRLLAGESEEIIVRSSVIGETIWERGSYTSKVISCQAGGFEKRLIEACLTVRSSTEDRKTGLVIQTYLRPRSRGEFGNLLRISKTRDHWELSTDGDDIVSRTRFNTQRDTAANAFEPLRIKSAHPKERLFASIAAWLNNELLRGRSIRLNLEWVTDNRNIYLTQIDEETEDFTGINPFQIEVAKTFEPKNSSGRLLVRAEERHLPLWDKLKALEELWESNVQHRPIYFFVPFSQLAVFGDFEELAAQLESDFFQLIGPDNIVVRTSVAGGVEKITNLPRTDCVTPAQAAKWCIEQISNCNREGKDINGFAFVAHRFIAARASAWARAEPGNPVVEIHSLWGLPDALQYCPYDIWEVHVPTDTSTEDPDYKSNMLMPLDGGRWDYVRIKNELARSLSIGRKEALDIAHRTAAICERIGRACHVMWFVGCVAEDGKEFSLPWYWTKAHAAEKNLDRTTYKIFTIPNRDALDRFLKARSNRHRQAIELKPTDLSLMRDDKFIEAVGEAAKKAGVPVILAGSTLAHAYYQLRRVGCTIVTLGEKEHTRVRRQVSFGKLVRDKIPTRIAARKELEVSQKIPPEFLKRFLISKLVEEALEVRNATSSEEKTTELADLFEVFRALAALEGTSLESIYKRADEKKEKAGGFDEGILLFQTGIGGHDKATRTDKESTNAEVLARKNADDTVEIPFSFFGFMELDQPRSITFSELAVCVELTLKPDRLELRVIKASEQYELPLELNVEPYNTSAAKGEKKK